MDFHGSYARAVGNLRDAVRVHRKGFPEAAIYEPTMGRREDRKGPNIANGFKRTFYQIMMKFQWSGQDVAAATVLALPKAVWDSWQPFLGRPEIVHWSGSVDVMKTYEGEPPPNTMHISASSTLTRITRTRFRPLRWSDLLSSRQTHSRITHSKLCRKLCSHPSRAATVFWRAFGLDSWNSGRVSQPSREQARTFQRPDVWREHTLTNSPKIRLLHTAQNAGICPG